MLVKIFSPDNPITKALHGIKNKIKAGQAGVAPLVDSTLDQYLLIFIGTVGHVLQNEY